MPLFLCSIIKLTESHGDLFSRHDSPVEVCVFVAVDERGEYVMSDEICRRCNGKQQRRKRGGRILTQLDHTRNTSRDVSPSSRSSAVSPLGSMLEGGAVAVTCW